MGTGTDLMPSQYSSMAPATSDSSGGYIHDNSGRPAAPQPQPMPSQVAALRKERERREERRETLAEAPPSYNDARDGPGI